MCGIVVSCGGQHLQGQPGKLEAWKEELTANLQRGIGMIKHRGPDESGVWISADGRVGLSHCRLSINDLSASGSQPLHTKEDSIHAVVMGEIYDYDRLRELCIAEDGYDFRSESDSELVIALYIVYGAPGLFEHLRGEFAFVLFDEREGLRKVIAARDRFGIKPLLWTVVDDRVLLAAEAKAFLPMGWTPEWDMAGITNCGWFLDDRTIFKGVKRLMPGHWMEINDQGGMEIRRYWDADYPEKVRPSSYNAAHIYSRQTKADARTVDDMILGVRERLVEAVRLRLRADVPVGVYLSGGIDSSAVAGIVTDLIRYNNVKLGAEETSRVKCFSIRFADKSGYDESGTVRLISCSGLFSEEIAQRTAEWLDVDTIMLDISEDSLAEDFASAAYNSEHHHFDLHSVCKFALSRLAREHGVKVILTGEGSDEHFCGYPVFRPEFLQEPDLNMPHLPLCRDEVLRERLYRTAREETNAAWRSHARGDKANLAAETRKSSSIVDSLAAWQPSERLYLEPVRKLHLDCWCKRETVMAIHSAEVQRKIRQQWHPAHSAMYLWNKSIFPNILLACLGDRSEMAHGIEGRTPFLDHHLVEYVNSLPPSVKLKFTPPKDDGTAGLDRLTEKWILREAVRPHITKELYQRSKVTFWAPLRWPRNGRLHSMFKHLLTREAVDQLGFIDYHVVQGALDKAFGDAADPKSFRIVCYTGSWVAISQSFGVKKASI
ncbi:hypothetical protein L249_0787 [Ophiocordyceps polyrhachis-furcata BCC 54312]|uniref:Glutamine amidotransferase type-2 domain-containing protein n=1 Tax=Ophiocordyceps polyrhachis-furcata BCC 54312 TaxID=1330021 RepID=A0A367LE03_9HYPO|nr:hypothetical protein L249_0787 [Ophiocordyceps polyrhachis-furcata BCC 54312]